MEENGSAAMPTTKRSAGVAPEVSFRECVTCMSLPSMNKVAHSGFETQRRHHQKSKIGVSVTPQKGLMSSKKNFKKKKKLHAFLITKSKQETVIIIKANKPSRNTKLFWAT